MSAQAATVASGTEAPANGGRKKLVLLVAPVLLLLVGAGLWFSGLLPGAGRHPAAQEARSSAPPAPVYAELPDIIANLNTGRRESFVKLKARLELGSPSDRAAVQAAMPRLIDLFQTYLREMRPEELRGSPGTYRLREELIARANLAAAPAHVVDVLFMDLLVQ